MTEQYDNEMKGVLFVNKDKKTDSHPGMKGSCQIDGKEYWVSAWSNTAKSGAKYVSMSFQSKDEAHSKGMDKAKQAAEPDPFEDSDIPFSNYEYRTLV